MRKTMHFLNEHLNRGESVALAVILKTGGSAPRGAGAVMAVDMRNRQAGTVGGGALENAVRQEALALLQNQKDSRLLHYHLTPGDAADLGMVCGGSVEVLVQRLLPEQHSSLICDACHALNNSISCGMLFALEGENESSVTLLKEGDAQPASLPVQETVFPKPYYDEGQFLLPICSGGRAVIFGGGHVSQALVPVLSGAGFPCVVLDDRPEFADKALFPQAQDVLLRDYAHLQSNALPLRPSDYVVILTRGHQGDFDALCFALKHTLAYIGCIGSKRKLETVRQRLSEAGFAPEDFSKVYAPIGLDIGAVTPGELAVSIAGEMIAHRAGKMSSRSLKKT